MKETTENKGKFVAYYRVSTISREAGPGWAWKLRRKPSWIF